MQTTETERVRQGSGPLDNLVVLIASLAILAVISLGLALYWNQLPANPPAVTQAR
jgi:hypothetical protein